MIYKHMQQEECININRQVGQAFKENIGGPLWRIWMKCINLWEDGWKKSVSTCHEKPSGPFAMHPAAFSLIKPQFQPPLWGQKEIKHLKAVKMIYNVYISDMQWLQRYLSAMPLLISESLPDCSQTGSPKNT